MQIIGLSNGRRAIRKDGRLFQEIEAGSRRVLDTFAKQRWCQHLGDAACDRLPVPRPVKLAIYAKGMFVEDRGDRIFVEPGDALARDGDGRFFSVPADKIRDYAFLDVPSDASRETVDEAAMSVLARMGRVRKMAQDRKNSEEQSPFSIEEDDKGRSHVVSTLPDGRQKVWKTFAGKAYAEKFLANDETRAALSADHDKSCRSVRSVNTMAHAFRMKRKRDLEI